MKEKMRGIAAILMIAMLAACGNLLDPPQAGRDGGTGTVRIAIEGASAGARTLMPGPDEFTLYTASFSGPGAQDNVVVTGGVLDLDLTVGSWTIAVAASTGTDPSYTEVGRGSATVEVARDQTVPANIVIAPLAGGGEQGDFSYSVTIPAAVDSATLSLLNSASAAVGGTPVDLKTAAVEGVASGTLSSLPAGYYFMNIRLEKGGQSIGRTEAAHIYKGLTTTAEYVFAAGDFDAVVDLVDGFWHDGEIPVSGEKHYYRFPVTSGLRYGVWVNDRIPNVDQTVSGGYGDGTKTLNIGVTAMYEGGDSIFVPSDGFAGTLLRERRYILPQLFTASSNSNVTLEVARHPTIQPNNTGTFAIKYGEVKPLSAGTAETGTLAAAGGAHWYSFFPDTSTLYTVSWEDSGDQSGSSYTGDVTVTGFETVRNITFESGAQGTADAAFNRVDSGYATPQVLISSNNSNANRLQLIRVEAETGGSYALKYAEPTVTPLVAGTAVSDTIAAGEVKLYSFSGAAGGEISWEDSGDQDANSTYTGDITVTAFYISNASTGHLTFRFDTVDSGYATPQILSASATYIKVAVKKGASGGTYSIKYQQP